LWSTIKEFIEVGYYLAGIGLFGTFIIGLKQLEVLKKDLNDRNQRAAVEKSLEFLHFYSNELLPLCNEYQKQLKTEITNPCNVKHLFNNDFILDVSSLGKDILTETIVRDKIGATHILNRLEFFSTAMLNGVADADLVYSSVSKHFCDVVEEEYVLLCIQRGRNPDTLFKNVVELYNVWKKRQEIENLAIERTNVEKKISQLGSNKDLKKPIGL
jgi:hypothetical protein